mgnify:CR=1 FL=1
MNNSASGAPPRQEDARSSRATYRSPETSRLSAQPSHGAACSPAPRGGSVPFATTRATAARSRAPVTARVVMEATGEPTDAMEALLSLKAPPRTAHGCVQYAHRLMELNLFFPAACILKSVLHAGLTEQGQLLVRRLLVRCGVAQHDVPLPSSAIGAALPLAS